MSDRWFFFWLGANGVMSLWNLSTGDYVWAVINALACVLLLGVLVVQQ